MPPNTKLPTDRLSADWHRLSQRWQRSTALWDDVVQRDFEQRYWDPLADQAQSVHCEMAALQLAIDRAKRELK